MALSKECKHCGLEVEDHDGYYCPNQHKKFEPKNSLDDAKNTHYEDKLDKAELVEYSNYPEFVLEAYKRELAVVRKNCESLTQKNVELKREVENQRETIDKQYGVIEDKNKEVRMLRTSINVLEGRMSTIEDLASTN